MGRGCVFQSRWVERVALLSRLACTKAPRRPGALKHEVAKHVAAQSPWLLEGALCKRCCIVFSLCGNKVWLCDQGRVDDG